MWRVARLIGHLCLSLSEPSGAVFLLLFWWGTEGQPCFPVVLPAPAFLGTASCLSPSESCTHEDSPVSRDLSTRQGGNLQKREEK